MYGGAHSACDTKRMAKKAKDPGKLEAALKELEALVERLENGDLSLEESLAEFERGVHGDTWWNLSRRQPQPVDGLGENGPPRLDPREPVSSVTTHPKVAIKS